MLRFTRGNWDRFETRDKQQTTRTKLIKIGEHRCLSGSYYRPFVLGWVEVTALKKTCRVDELTLEDAILDGFPTLDEYIGELQNLNKKITPDTVVNLYLVKRIDKDLVNWKT